MPKRVAFSNFFTCDRVFVTISSFTDLTLFSLLCSHIEQKQKENIQFFKVFLDKKKNYNQNELSEKSLSIQINHREKHMMKNCTESTVCQMETMSFWLKLIKMSKIVFLYAHTLTHTDSHLFCPSF